MFVIVLNCNFIVTKTVTCSTQWDSRIQPIIRVRIHQKISVFNIVMKFFIKGMENYWNILVQIK